MNLMLPFDARSAAHLNQRWRNGHARYRPPHETINPLHYQVGLLPNDAEAKAFVLAHHYSGSYPAARFRIGLFRAAQLVGVAVYSHPTNDRVLTNVFPGAARDSVELGRFVLLDDVPGNGESWFLARTFELLRKFQIQGVVSFSDPVPRFSTDGQLVMPGHVGTIYQSHNGRYLGRSTPRQLRLLPNGQALSDRALQKLRTGERGWHYVAELLHRSGAPQAPDSAVERRFWIREQLPVSPGGSNIQATTAMPGRCIAAVASSSRAAPTRRSLIWVPSIATAVQLRPSPPVVSARLGSMAPRVKARFVTPMLLLKTDRLPEGNEWSYELKFDGYRAIAFKSGGQIFLRSRADNDFGPKYPAIVKALARLPADTVIDGEVVAFDEAGRPSFNVLQNLGTRPDTPLGFFVFDVLILRGRDLMHEPLAVRRELLQAKVVPTFAPPAAYMPPLNNSLRELIESVRAEGFEGLTAKRLDSVYEPGERSGLWQKMRVNRGQEFVIGGYTVGNPFDAVIFGYYEGSQLLYAARTRAGFTPASRAQLAKKFKGLEVNACPFANLPEKRPGRWGQGITRDKMKDCRWLKPELVGQFEFVEWTADHHLRHSRFVALREDRPAREVVREQ